MPRRRAAGLPAKKISQGLPVSRVRHDRRGDGERRRRSSPSPPRRDEEIPKCPPIHKRLREVSVASTYSCCYPPDSELGKTSKHETAVDQQLNRRLKERLSDPRRSGTKAECRRERPPMRHVMDVVVMEGRTKTDESAATQTTNPSKSSDHIAMAPKVCPLRPRPSTPRLPKAAGQVSLPEQERRT